VQTSFVAGSVRLFVQLPVEAYRRDGWLEGR